MQKKMGILAEYTKNGDGRNSNRESDKEFTKFRHAGGGARLLEQE